jgi:DNA polymerase elongation subunit (family B)
MIILTSLLNCCRNYKTILQVIFDTLCYYPRSYRLTITVAANGIMYVKSKVRKGLLGRMLAELLDTRVMVKQAMKSVSGDKVGSLGIYNVNKGTDT